MADPSISLPDWELDPATSSVAGVGITDGGEGEGVGRAEEGHRVGRAVSFPLGVSFFFFAFGTSATNMQTEVWIKTAVDSKHDN